MLIPIPHTINIHKQSSYHHNNYYHHHNHYYHNEIVPSTYLKSHQVEHNNIKLHNSDMFITIIISTLLYMSSKLSSYIFHAIIIIIIIIIRFLTTSLASLSTPSSTRVRTVSSLPSILAMRRAVCPSYNNNEEMRHENKMKNKKMLK